MTSNQKTLGSSPSWGSFLLMLMDLARSTVFTVFCIRVAYKCAFYVSNYGLLGTASLIKNSFLQAIISAAKVVPGGRQKIDEEIGKVLEELKAKIAVDSVVKYSKLPEEGLEPNEMQNLLERLSKKTLNYKEGKISGTVYHNLEDTRKVIEYAQNLFYDSNPLHPDIFPGTRQMEADVVSCVLDLYHGTENCCGTMTSGGTESILLACKTYRDFRGIADPEMYTIVIYYRIIPQSAHAAFFKASAYFNIKLVIVSVDKNGQVDPKMMEKAITKRTIMVL